MEISTLQLVIALVGMVLLVVGPGSGIYIALHRSINGAVEDVGEIKKDLHLRSKRYDEDHSALIVALERLSVHDREIKLLRDAKHEQGNSLSRIEAKLDFVAKDLKRE